MRITILFCCLLPWLAWAHPHSHPHSDASAAPLPDKERALQSLIEAGEEHEVPPNAKDENRPAIFGAMIAGAQQERAGIGIPVIRRKSIMPWIFSLLLLPVYVYSASRRGFRIR